MKILLYITSFRQLEEYKFFSIFLKSLNLNNIVDVYIYCNNSVISSDILNYYQMFDQKNKYLLVTSLNSGYRIGGVEAISKGIETNTFQEYDYVIHVHADVFITGDTYLLNILTENINNDIVFFVNKENSHEFEFAFDFFIFKPKLLLKNIFLEDLYIFKESPECYLYNMILRYDIKYMIIKRFENNNWYPRRIDENLNLYHEHDLDNVVKILSQKNLI